MIEPLKIPIRQGVLNYVNKKFNNKEKLEYTYKYISKGIKKVTIKNLKKDVLIYVIYYLAKATKEENKGIYLNSLNVRKYVIDVYKPYIDFLENELIIILVRKYVKGVQSNLYLLTNTYFDFKKQYVHYTITDTRLLKKVNFNNKGLSEGQLISIEECKSKRHHLVKNFNENLLIDTQAAYKEIDNLSKDVYDANAITVLQFNQQIWTYKITEKDFRLHTIFTRINKKLLKYITYKNQKLGEIDFKSSQPLFFYIILKTIFDGSMDSVTGKYLKNKLSNSFIKKIQKKGIDIDELNTYENYLLNHDLYVEVSKRIKTNPSDEKGFYYLNKSEKPFEREYFDTKRNLVKRLVMRSFYNGKGDEITEFKKLFPSIFEIVNLINEEKNITTAKSNLAHILQSFEAHVVLDLISKDISKKFKDIPLFSKHDSIITYTSALKDVNTFVLKRFQYYFGFSKEKLIVHKDF